MNRQDIAHQVSLTLGDHIEDFNVDGIVDDLIAAHDGNLTSIDDFDSQAYWAIVETHDTTTDEAEKVTATAWLTLDAGCLIHGEGVEVGILDYDDTDQVTGEPLAPVSLPVSLAAACEDHKVAQNAAEARLSELGWDTVGSWDAVDTGYTIKVRRVVATN
ncbi:hypothetical protein AB0L71_28275 [Streptomyces sp. NPDC052052]|uniref:hypothetical protein n=1 Tax=Streptomyces sp. NPDC052052 TaxID=3154756 RepID=UPI003434CD21